MATKRGLGRGISELIPTGESKAKNTTKKSSEKEVKVVEKVVEKVIEKPTEQKLKITDIEPNKDQPRKNFDEDALSELSDSIKKYGVIEPVVVVKKNKHYEIIAGERRWRAARLAGLKEIPVIIRDYDLQQQVEIALIENLQRENLNPIEEAHAYQRLIDEFDLKQDEVAEKVSKGRTTITNSLRLLKLCEKVQQMLINEMISTGHARSLIAIEDPDVQYETAMTVFDRKMSVRDTEKLVKSVLKILSGEKNEEVKPEVKDFTPIYKDIEEKLKNVLGTKAVIKTKDNKKGKIEIDYYSQDDLERILDLIYGQR